MTKKYLNTNELSELIRTSTRQIQRWRDEGKIRYIQIGRKIIYDFNDVEVFLSEHTMERF